MRRSGVLLHISSLPGPDGIGSLGPEAYAFADFLHDAGMTVWQVLPIGPTGFGNSPYSSVSAFAGNPLLISVDLLQRDGLLPERETGRLKPDDMSAVDYDAVRAYKDHLLRDAFAHSRKKVAEALAEFRHTHGWVDDYALFVALKQRYGGRMWSQWPDRDVRLRRPEALIRCRREMADEIAFQAFCQYLFFRQWHALRDYCRDRGILLLGDLPIYVSEDSADTWTHPEIFQLDRGGVPVRRAGVPPDFFSEDGQLWGNPLYRWFRLRLHRYDWWVARMRALSECFDIVRIDHFIGLANYWSVPGRDPTARHGKWVRGPGASLFRRLKKALPDLRIIAEDLGVWTPRVARLLRQTGIPGTRTIIYAFGGDDTNMHLPSVISENTVYYTGTHDNPTVLAWAESAPAEELDKARRLCGFDSIADAPAALVRTVLESCADTAVIPMQDLLGLGAEATMNHPGTAEGNWQWRMLPGAAGEALAARLRALNQQTGRLISDD